MGTYVGWRQGQGEEWGQGVEMGTGWRYGMGHKKVPIFYFYKDSIYSRNGNGMVGTRHGPFNVRSTVN